MSVGPGGGIRTSVAQVELDFSLCGQLVRRVNERGANLVLQLLVGLGSHSQKFRVASFDHLRINRRHLLVRDLDRLALH